jgi:hypothetical protein
VVLIVFFAILASLPGIVALYQASRKTPVEVSTEKARTDLTKADYAAKLQDIAGQATVENLGLRTELTKLRNEFDQFKLDHANELSTLIAKYDLEIQELKEAHISEMTELKKSLLASQKEAQEWREYASRLISQFKAEVPDVEPVPFQPRKTRPREEIGRINNENEEK